MGVAFSLTAQLIWCPLWRIGTTTRFNKFLEPDSILFLHFDMRNCRITFQWGG